MIKTSGLDDDEAALLEAHLETLRKKRERNLLRSLYYDAKRMPMDLGVTMPPGMMQRVGAVLGWPAKAVDALVQRVHWQGVVADDPGITGELGDLAAANHLDSELPQAFASALEHSCSFLAVTKGDDSEPDAVVSVKDALNATGEWDYRRRCLSSALSVVDRSNRSPFKPTSVNLYLPGETLAIEWDQPAKTWNLVDFETTPLGGVPVEVLPSKAKIGRPFGQSRISRPVMAITDMAVRTVIRSEIGAEFYAIPQRWLMGADASAFGLEGTAADTWKLLIGRIMALGDDEDATNPRAQVGQFPQISMQPHMDQLRSLAQLFSGETSIPVSSLGISIDSNPTSADSYAASREDIIAEAEATITAWRGAISRTMANAWMIAGRGDAPTIQARFRDPRYTSRAAAADAFVKIAGAMPWIADTDIAVELLGFDDVTTERLKVERKRAAARAAIATLADRPTEPAAATTGMDTKDAKAKFDALGTAIRAGVSPESAAAKVGLTGLEFTGAVPVSLRVPESQAAQLEE